MLIRDFTLEDKEEILNLGKTLHKDYFINNLDEPNHILVAEKDHKIVGFLHFLKFTDYIDIVDIVVNEVFRKQGIGSSLLKELEKFNPHEILLEVCEDNTTAIKFYLQNGFNKVGIRKGYYAGIDGITMKKVII